MTDMIAVDIQPFLMVEDVFNTIMAYLEPDYKNKLYNDCSAIGIVSCQTPSYVALTTDFWSSINMLS